MRKNINEKLNYPLRLQINAEFPKRPTRTQHENH